MALALRVEDLRLRYPRAPAPALAGVSLAVARGERILVTGPSGSGKSSLALCWSGIVPHSIPAEVSGVVELAGRAVAEAQVAELADRIAYVFQDADSQLCALSVEDEVAFALENRALPPPEIDRRIGAAMSMLGLPAAMRTRETRSLSGGEKQKVVLAAALAQDVPLYVFDEPTSQLDPEATAITYAVIDRLARGGHGRTLVYIDHKVESLLPLTDRVLLLGEDGVPRALDPPARLFHDRADLVAETGAWLPAAARLFHHLRAQGVALATRPLTLARALADLDEAAARDASKWVDLRAGVASWLDGEARPAPGTTGAPILALEGVSFAPTGGPDIVSDVSLTLQGGEILGLVGRNGAGKSTLGQIMAGLLRPTGGARRSLIGPAGEAGQFLFQNPEHQFVSDNVREELLLGLLAAQGGARAPAPDRAAAAPAAAAALRAFGLWDKRDAHPFQLSQGQKRRLSFLAATMAPSRPVLVLDEPSYGLDARAARRLRDQIRRERRDDRAIVVITHDIDWLAGLCDRVAVMDGGRVMRVGPAGEVLGDAPMLARAGLAPPLTHAVAAWLDARA